MRIIKLAFISFTIFFVILTGISLFIPSDIRLAKQVNVSGSKDSIFGLIKNKDQWRRWHPAFKENFGKEASDAFDKIESRIISENDSVLSMEWQQKGKKAIRTGWQVYNETISDSATLQWHMDFRLSWYPWQKFGSLFYENNYGRMMEQGLYNIKEEVEKQPAGL